MADLRDAPRDDSGWTVLDGKYFREQVRLGLATFFRPWSPPVLSRSDEREPERRRG